MAEAAFGDSGTAKAYFAGTHRACPPEQTIARVLAFREELGITRVADITGLDHVGVPVVSVYRPNSRSLVTAQGKGTSLAAAKASALMEALESYHAEHTTLPLRLASHRELSSMAAVVDPALLPRARGSRFHRGLQILWVEALNLLGQDGTETVWIPFECVHSNFTLPLPTGSGSFLLSSNGLASGNHLIEAISHGLCEVVERHANTLWQLQPQLVEERRITLASVTDPECRHILDRLENARIIAGAWDISSEVEIPCVLVEIVDADDDPSRVAYATSGLGCHPSPSIALSRALTEAAQCRLTFISGARDDADRDVYERVRNRAAIQQARDRLRRAPQRGVDFGALLDRSHPSLEDDLHWELAQLARAGVEQVLVVDLTQERIGVPVVRVVIPGLEGIHDVPDYVPGARALAYLPRATT